MAVSFETEQEVRATMARYCEAIDDADFETFAGLYEHGKWFMAPEPGAQSVLDWLNSNTVLYDGKTLTRHEIANLIVEDTSTADEVAFRCYGSIWMDPPEEDPLILAHVRFKGTFRRVDGRWWLHTHEVTPGFIGDFGRHVKGGV